MKILVFFLLAFSLSACSKNSLPKRRRIFISEKPEIHLFPSPPHTPLPPPHPFRNNSAIKKIPLITINSFTCKGSSESSDASSSTHLQDCPGGKYHGFPQYNGKDYIHPELLFILNHIRAYLQSKVSIITGHRCQKHHTYCHATDKDLPHVYGCAATFIVEKSDITPEMICNAVKTYYASFSDPQLSTFTTEEPFPNMSNSTITLLFFNPSSSENTEHTSAKLYAQIIMKNIPKDIEIQ